MATPKILIVGCGAVGLSQGFHLAAGAEITYLVRPGRSGAFEPPKRLYDYKTDKLHTFENYRVIESTTEVTGEEFYCVFDTLDGRTAQSEGGVATLKSVGDLIRNVPKTFVIYDAVGADIEQHYASTMGIPKERLVLAFSMLAHQPTPMISVPPSANRDLVAQADMLYSHLGADAGLAIVNKNVELTKKTEAVYNQNGRLKIQRQPAIVGDMVMLVIVQLVVWHIEDWPECSRLSSSGESWALLIRAQKEILSLPRFGWTGWVLSWLIGSWATAKMIESPAKGALPLAYHEFNAFHHGNKVVQQDVMALEDLVAQGEKAKVKMVALQEICRQARKKLEK
ncbi:ketopantoate reductase ApbA/PanE domain-containing protein [Karstenula rhodostoma CBS 690.94]|uniref:Ketopantoate reductase ApbA/PanE domain-containing protein n=1 Tax=Karstenula rhodostoma CBS 690.94 TaxID=1392251 RepID=A0A9P4U5D9_9PLEO|nr:ketopantoate reductase ApbA/PanE domain-containing protein [Karstenula rhodostoma CBS 690.94]